MSIIDLINQFLAINNFTQLATQGVWSYLLLAVVVAVEGPIATLLGAVAASFGLMNPGFVFLAASTGNLTSDTLWYTLGRMGKIQWLERFGKRLGINPVKLQQLEHMLHKHAPTILFFSKLTVSPMIPALIATGLIKYPWKRWFPYVFMGEMIWTGSLLLIGYFGVAAIRKVQLGIEHAILVITVLFIASVLYFGRRFLKKEIDESPEETDEAEERGE